MRKKSAAYFLALMASAGMAIAADDAGSSGASGMESKSGATSAAENPGPNDPVMVRRSAVGTSGTTSGILSAPGPTERSDVYIGTPGAPAGDEMGSTSGSGAAASGSSDGAGTPGDAGVFGPAAAPGGASTNPGTNMSSGTSGASSSLGECPPGMVRSTNTGVTTSGGSDTSERSGPVTTGGELANDWPGNGASGQSGASEQGGTSGQSSTSGQTSGAGAIEESTQGSKEIIETEKPRAGAITEDWDKSGQSSTSGATGAGSSTMGSGSTSGGTSVECVPAGSGTSGTGDDAGSLGAGAAGGATSGGTADTNNPGMPQVSGRELSNDWPGSGASGQSGASEQGGTSGQSSTSGQTSGAGAIEESTQGSKEIIETEKPRAGAITEDWDKSGQSSTSGATGADSSTMGSGSR